MALVNDELRALMNDEIKRAEKRTSFITSVLILSALAVFLVSSEHFDNSCLQEKYIKDVLPQHIDTTSGTGQSIIRVPTGSKNDGTGESMIRVPSRSKNDPNPDAPYPRVAWLMSYPNSGTSYTMNLVRTEANLTTVATNYGLEDKKSAKNVPLYDDSPNGPYLLDPTKTLPPKYILTKTHCGGRCLACHPDAYIETAESFLDRCAQGNKKVEEGAKMDQETLYYDPGLVQRAIHLIRNPFDNIVSNYHLYRKQRARLNDIDWLTTYTNDEEGFRKWCSYEDEAYLEEEKQMLPGDFVAIFSNEPVPCHAQFYKYAKWHDYAIQTIKKLELPTSTLFYEDYGKNFTKNEDAIFKFLELSKDQDAPPFEDGKTYVSYFTEKEQSTAFKLMKVLVSRETRDLINTYQT